MSERIAIVAAIAYVLGGLFTFGHAAAHTSVSVGHYSGICAGCEVKHGYRDRLIDDVDPPAREPKEIEQ